MNYLYLSIFIPLIFLFSNKITKLIKLYDYPDNKRKIHSRPILIVGGIFFQNIILFYFLFFLFFYENNFFSHFKNNHKDLLILLFTVSLSFIVGLYDDKKNLNPLVKLFLMFIIFSFSLYFLSDFYHLRRLNSFFDYYIYFDRYSIIFTSFCFVILLNATNMSDGINSLTSNIFIIWLFFITLFIPKDNFYFFMNIILILSLILFSILNFRNKCFLGDSGCFVLASYLSYVTVYAYNKNLLYSDKNYLNVESIFLLFLVPGIDMLRLFLRRIYNGNNPFKADKNHFHHKLLKNFGNFKAIIIYNSMILIPWLVYLYMSSMLPYIIIVVLVIYFIFIVKIKKIYEKN